MRDTRLIYAWGNWYCCTARFLPAAASGNRFAKPPGAASVPELRAANKAYATRKNEVTTFRLPG